MSKSITAEELELIKQQQVELNNVVANIGVLETQKHSLLHQVADMNGKLEETKKVLEDKYGSISINLETGEYEEIKAEEKSE